MQRSERNIGKNRSSNHSPFRRKLREFWRMLVTEAVAALPQYSQPQPLLQPVRVNTRALDRNRPSQRY